MKIYTKKGDKGKTQLLGGTIIDKCNYKIEAYGNIDELNSFIGHLHDQKINKNHKKFLLKIQSKLLNLGSIISFDGKKKDLKLPQVLKSDVEYIEKEIDKLEEDLPQISSFILPSGDSSSSLCHIARSVCRRAERGLVFLSSQEKIEATSLQFLNRLSDYLFVLSRKILQEKNKSETYWK